MRYLVIIFAFFLASCGTRPPPITLYQYNQIPANLIEPANIPIPPNIDQYLKTTTEERLSIMHDYSRSLLRVLHDVNLKLRSLKIWDNEQMKVWNHANE